MQIPQARRSEITAAAMLCPIMPGGVKLKKSSSGEKLSMVKIISPKISPSAAKGRVPWMAERACIIFDSFIAAILLRER
jgi:hypothetical protein